VCHCSPVLGRAVLFSIDARTEATAFPKTQKQRYTKPHFVSRLVAPFFVILASLSVHAAPDDIEPPKQEDQADGQKFQMDEASFDANVFQPSGNAKQARKQIETKLKLQLDELNRVCGLNDAQTHKLKLAGSSDIKRFFDEVSEVRKKVTLGMLNQNQWNQIWQDIQPIRTRQTKGLFGETSFYSKAVRKTLTDDQMARYDIVVNERRRFRYRASIEVAMTNLESAAPLRHSQHEAIVKLLLDETQPPPTFGEYDNYLIMHQLAKLSETRLKPLLDEPQWKQMEAQFNQARGMEQFLIQNGLLPKKEVDDILIMADVEQPAVQSEPAADAEIPENVNSEKKPEEKSVPCPDE
jgi:hypothetical protein